MIEFYNKEAEEAVIGAIILESTAFEKVEYLLPEMFYFDNHKIIFRNAKEIFERGNKIDTISLSNELKKNKEVEQAGGLYELSVLTTKVSSCYHITEHAEIVKELYVRRFIYLSTHGLQEKIKDQTIDVIDVVDVFNTDVEKISGDLYAKDDNVILKECTKEALQVYQDRKTAHLTGKTYGINTGIKKLNELTAGWQNSWLCIIAARPAMGKTSEMIFNAIQAAKSGRNVVIYSLEMNRLELTNKIILSECEISSTRLMQGNLTEFEEKDYFKAADLVYSLPITIIDKPNLTVGQIRSSARMLKKKGKCEIVFIDYIQYIKANSKGKNFSRENEVSDISKSLKAMAKELDIPVIALSQLNRGCEDRPSKRPMLSDLRESGSIEQDADFVAFLWRPAYYHIQEYEGEKTDGLMVVDVAKFRHGGIGEIVLYHNQQMTRFKESKQPERTIDVNHNFEIERDCPF